MSPSEQQTRIRFESFDLNVQTRELRRHGRPVKLQDQPSKLLVLLACRAGELVTRAEIEKALWREGEFVEFDHAVNTAMRKVREALGDDLVRPRFIETLPRKGYRFIATVDTSPGIEPPRRAEAAGIQPVMARSGGKTGSGLAVQARDPKGAEPGVASAEVSVAVAEAQPTSSIAADSAPADTGIGLSRPLARSLFLVIQLGYLAMYSAALYRVEGVEEVLAGVLPGSARILAAMILMAAMCGIAIRLYLLSAVSLKHPAAGEKFRRLFPALFILDTLWAASPLLLIHQIGYGLALGSIAPLAYLPFSQRTLVESVYRRSASLP